MSLVESMGKGGEKGPKKAATASKQQDAVVASSSVLSTSSDLEDVKQTKSYKLFALSTEELRKWAKSYGEKEYDGDRIKLLEVLVFL